MAPTLLRLVGTLGHKVPPMANKTTPRIGRGTAQLYEPAQWRSMRNSPNRPPSGQRKGAFIGDAVSVAVTGVVLQH